MDRVHTSAIVLETEEEGGFTVRVPSLPEIVTFGKDEDEDEALAMAEDAIRLVLKDCLARGQPIPGGQPPVFVRLRSRSPHERAAAVGRG
jgi:antitoxin HicB